MVSRHTVIFIAFLISFCAAPVLASGLNDQESQCYSVSMVGYDSVINSGLGVPLEQVIETMVTHNNSTIAIYKDYLLFVVMDAYNWDGTPHTYAVKTLFDCAVRHGESVSD